MKMKRSKIRKISNQLCLILLGIMILIGFSGCFGKPQRVVSNYYILDYHKSSELPNLRMQRPFPVNIEVRETNVPRTYNRNQLVVKEHFSKIKYLPNELWASRLYDAIPNLIVQRYKAYNIVQRIDRDLGEIIPHYYLETTILNIEMIEDEIPMAYIRMEFFLREGTSQKVVMSYQNEASEQLLDRSIISLVQSYNKLLMQETNVFAAKTIEFLSGKEVYKAPQIVLAEAVRITKERMDIDDSQYQYGELYVPLIQGGDIQMQYAVNVLDEMKNVEGKIYGEFGKPLKLRPGKYIAILNESNLIEREFEIEARLRTVLKPDWGELVVKIVDESQTRVRMSYTIFIKNVKEEGFTHVNQGYSVGDEEIGEQDKIWILDPGNYMIKLQGGSWSDLKDFATVDVPTGHSRILTLVVDTQGERSVLIGAGVLGDDDLLAERRRIHRGALHANVSLTSNNSVDRDKPSRSFSMSGQFDNRIEYHLLNFHYSMRSIYDLGMNIATDSEFRINVDDYSFRNTLLLLPFEKKKYAKNLGLYGRADLTTHFFDEYTYFSNDRNLLLISALGDTLSKELNQSSLRTKTAFFPMRLREGSGLTYRLVISPSISLSLRGGYGWQQEYRNRSFVLDRTGVVSNGQSYDLYLEDGNIITHGLESTLIFTALNLLNFLSVTSTFDVLFPRESEDTEPKFVSENRFNIRLLRNVSIDVKADVKYDKANKDYITYDYSSFLRLSLYY